MLKSVLIVALAMLGAGCTNRNVELACTFEADTTVMSEDSSAGFNALDVLDHLGVREYAAEPDAAYLLPSFDRMTLTWSLADDPIHTGSLPTGAQCQEENAGLAVPVNVRVDSSDASLVLEWHEYVFATALSDASMSRASGMPRSGEVLAVPSEYLEYAIGAAGGTLDDPEALTALSDAPAAPVVTVQYNGTTPDGATGVPVVHVRLIP